MTKRLIPGDVFYTTSMFRGNTPDILIYLGKNLILGGSREQDVWKEVFLMKQGGLYSIQVRDEGIIKDTPWKYTKNSWLFRFLITENMQYNTAGLNFGVPFFTVLKRKILFSVFDKFL